MNEDAPVSGIRFFPEQAATGAAAVDALFYALILFSFALGIFLTVLVILFITRYRAGSSADRSTGRASSLRLEIGWTLATLVVAFSLFAWGAILFTDRFKAPPDSIEIAGIGKQWMWTFRHAGGQREINELHVPVGRPVVVSLGSEDVIHSFFVPAFRSKQDAVPGRTTHVWFEASRPGRFHLFCAEYCGTEHAQMRGQIIAMEPAEFAAWLEHQGEGESLASAGERLFRSLGCSGCHAEAGQVRAPRLEGVYGRPVALEDGPPVVADEAYLRDSILMPERQVVAGFEPIMPSFDGLLEESELQVLIAYIKSLSPEEKVR